MGITVVGSLNADLVTYATTLPNAGETVAAKSFETHIGGKGLNQAIAIAKMKTDNDTDPVRMIGKIGSDLFGTQLLEALLRYHVDCTHVSKVKDLSTGVATILVEEETGQNRILITAGANSRTVFTDLELENIFQSHSEEYVVFQQEIPNPCSIMRWINLHRPNYQIVFNPSPFHPITNADYKNVDVLVVNEIEALQIAESAFSVEDFEYYKKFINDDFIGGYKLLTEQYQKTLIRKDKCGAVIVTLGAFGCLYASKENLTVNHVSAVSVEKVIDTTAAGDTFLGALVSQLYSKNSVCFAIKFAAAASSITITKNGAAESIPTYADVNQRVEQQ